MRQKSSVVTLLVLSLLGVFSPVNAHIPTHCAQEFRRVSSATTSVMSSSKQVNSSHETWTAGPKSYDSLLVLSVDYFLHYIAANKLLAANADLIACVADRRTLQGVEPP